MSISTRLHLLILYDPAVYRVAIDLVGPDKILFGSDFPLLLPSR